MEKEFQEPVHGGNLREIARIFNKDEHSLIDFSANINPLGMSKKAINGIIESIKDAENYPDNSSTNLINALASHHLIEPGQLLAGAGAIEFIYLIPRLTPAGKALIVGPAFSEYEQALKLSGWKVEYHLLKHDQNFQIDLQQLKKKLEVGYEQVWIANPANPTGKVTSPEIMGKIIEMARKLDTTVIVDEAFMDFCEESSLKHQVQSFENVILIRSMTKFFALAGLRVGYVIANSEQIKKLNQIKEPWRLNTLAEGAAMESLKDTKWIQATLKHIKTVGKTFIHQLEQFNFLEVYQGGANFVLVRFHEKISVSRLQKTLIQRENIVIRSGSNFRGLTPQYARFAIKSSLHNEHLITALKTHTS